MLTILQYGRTAMYFSRVQFYWVFEQKKKKNQLVINLCTYTTHYNNDDILYKVPIYDA